MVTQTLMLVRETRPGNPPRLYTYGTDWPIALAMQEWLCEGRIVEILQVYKADAVTPRVHVPLRQFEQAEARGVKTDGC